MKTFGLALLGRRRFRRLAMADGLSLTGEYVQLVGLAGVALATLHHASGWAEVLLAQALPQGLALPLGGLAADRYGAGRVVAVAGACQAVLALSLAWLVAGPGPSRGELFAYAALLGTCLGFTLPALSAAVTDSVPLPEVHRANGLLQVADNAARFLGSAAAALLLELGATLPFIAAAAAWALAAVVALGIGGRPGSRPGPTAGLGDLGAGLAAVRADTAVAALLPAIALFAMGYAGAIYVGLPALATFALTAGPAAIGTLYAAWGVGALAGALAVGARRGWPWGWRPWRPPCGRPNPRWWSPGRRSPPAWW